MMALDFVQRIRRAVTMEISLDTRFCNHVDIGINAAIMFRLGIADFQDYRITV